VAAVAVAVAVTMAAIRKAASLRADLEQPGIALKTFFFSICHWAIVDSLYTLSTVFRRFGGPWKEFAPVPLTSIDSNQVDKQVAEASGTRPPFAICPTKPFDTKGSKYS
jgi:hypothetical protein